MADYDNPTIDQMLDGIYTAFLDANANVNSVLLPLVRARNSSELKRFMIFHSAAYYGDNAGARLVTNPTEYFTDSNGFDTDNRDAISQLEIGEVVSVGLGVDVARLPDKFNVGDIVRDSKPGASSCVVTRNGEVLVLKDDNASTQVVPNEVTIMDFIKTGRADDDQMKKALWEMTLNNLEAIAPTNTGDKPKAVDQERGSW